MFNMKGGEAVRILQRTMPAAPIMYSAAIKDKYKDYFLVGNIYNNNNRFGPDREILLTHFNAITAENLMKPQFLQPESGRFFWGDADNMVDFAAENGLTVIGHTLVWHKQTPAWFADATASEAEQHMWTHIETVVDRYKGRIKGWDVVNEIIRDDIDHMPSVWNECIRHDCAWYRAIGEDDYIYRAYIYAHDADPNAELYYNDYNLDEPYKCEAAALLVEYINNRYKTEYNTDQNLITAVNMQSHYSLETRPEDVKRSIDRFRKLGLHINISELDVCLERVYDDEADVSAELTEDCAELQAEMYARLMMIYKANADIIDRVSFWGCRDDASWRRRMHPLLFNPDMTPKKAFYAVLNPDEYVKKHNMNLTLKIPQYL